MKEKEQKYGLVEISQNPHRELLVVPHKGKILTVGFPIFNNDEELKKTYAHPQTGEPIKFRPATTSESISALAYGFGEGGKVDFKTDVLERENYYYSGFFSTRHLKEGHINLGSIIATKEGIFTNTTETNESKLKELLNSAKKVNGIYLRDDGIAFAPYETYIENRGVPKLEGLYQNFEEFTLNPESNGLARALEHTYGKTAPKLAKIVSKINKEKICVQVYIRENENRAQKIHLGKKAHIQGGAKTEIGVGYRKNLLGVLDEKSNAQGGKK